MILIPAIDIKAGKVVRLFKGQFDKVTEYGKSPLDMAKKWEQLGAEYLHVVDLDAAKTGKGENREIIKRIARELKIPVETGGGVRSREVVAELIEAGIDRVIVGTKVVEDKDFVGEMLGRYPDRVAVSLDCRDGFVAQRGWLETSTTRGIDLARDLAKLGLKYIIYTDISRDGTLAGPDLKGLQQMLSVKELQVIASGGVKDRNDLIQLMALQADNLYGVITGKAIYEGTLEITEALELCSRKE